MERFNVWMAQSPVATVLKIAAAAGVGALIDYASTASVDPLWVVLAAAVGPVTINALNPEDPRYGRGRAPRLADAATSPEFHIEGED
jgi:hypothetical protein